MKIVHFARLLRIILSFAWQMTKKAWQAENKYGWASAWKYATNDQLQDSFNVHVRKGDPIDVAILSMMLWARGWDCK